MLLVKSAGWSWISDCLARGAVQTAQPPGPAAPSIATANLKLRRQNPSTNWSVRSAAPFLLPPYPFCCATQRPGSQQHPVILGSVVPAPKCLFCSLKLEEIQKREIQKKIQFCPCCWSVASGAGRGCGCQLCALLEPPSQLPVSPSRWC